MQETTLIENVPQPSKRKKIFKYFLIGLGSIVLFILLVIILVPLLFENQVKKIFINELNKNLATEVVVNEEDIDLTILKNFPHATIVFNNVSIRESIIGSKNNFAQAGQLSFVFNIKDILRKNYIIDEINLEDATLFLKSDKKGNINYKFWKDDTSSSNDNFSLTLKEVKCIHVNFQYVDLKNNQDIQLQLHDAVIQGDFNSDTYTLKTKCKLLSEKIEIAGTSYLSKKEIEADAELLINNETNTYTFKNGDVQIDKNLFEINGSIADAEKFFLDLQIESDRADLAALVLLLPGTYSNYAQNIKSKGRINFDATIKGNYTQTENPAVVISFNISDVSLSHEKFGDRLTDINCKGSYSNGALHNSKTSSLHIEDLDAKYGNEQIRFQLLYENFSDPEIDLSLEGNIPVSYLLNTKNPNIEDVNGYVNFENVKIKGRVKDIKSSSSNQIPIQGKFSFHNISCSLNNEPIKIESGTALLKDTEIQLTNCKGSLFESPFHVDMTLDNWVQNIFSSNLNNSPLYVNGDIVCTAIDINKLQALFKANTSSTEKENIKDPANQTLDWMNVSGLVNITANTLLYNKVNLKDVKCNIKFSPGFIGLSNLNGKTMQGNFNLQTYLRRIANGNYLLECIGILNTIDIQELFIELNNFGQSTLTEKNIAGNATTYIENLSVQWDKNLTLLPDKIYALINIKIENGELINYKPLESLSKFIDINELSHITFSTLQNQIEIKNSIITIPAMQIQSSAIGIYLSGSHTFDNKIDYQLKLSMADLMAKKFFKNQKNKENYEDGTSGGINIYITMTGSVEKPIIAYNKKEAKQKMQDQGIDKPAFFDIFKPDSPQVEENANREFKKKFETETQDTLEFIEWDEQ